NSHVGFITFTTYVQLLAPVVLVLREAMSVSPPQETNVTFGMLLKDVVYIATNHVYYELLNYLSFNKWVGIVFYGRKSLGGHNVVWRLYEAIKAHYQNIKLTGFL
ncbi:hypothetical protein ACJX0J_023365, partial [Zea mays]